MKRIIIFILLLNQNLYSQWETLYFPTSGVVLPNLNAVWFSSAQKGLAVGSNNNYNPVIIRTKNSGTTWDTVLYELSYNSEFKDLIMIDSSTSYAVGSFALSKGIIAKTNDFGNTWDTIRTSNILTAVDFPSNQIGYAVGLNGTILKTINSGSNWINLISPIINDFYSIQFVNDTIGFISGDSSIIKTYDGGVNWIIKKLNKRINALSFPSDSIGYCYSTSMDSTYLYKTIDCGTSWNLHSAYSTFNYNTSMFFINDTIGYITGVFKMEKTIDGGLTWKVQTSTLPSWGTFYDYVTDVYFVSVDTGFSVGAGGSGHIYRTYNGGELNSSLNEIMYDKEISIVPNPSQNIFTLKSSQELENAIVTVFNSTGQIVKTILNVNAKQMAIDMTGMINGLYLIEIHLGEKRILKKILLAQ